MLPVSMWLMVVQKMGTHLGLSVLAFNWAGTLIQHKLLRGFQFPQIKASAVSFFQRTGRSRSAVVRDVLFVYPYDSIFCVLLNCCEEKGRAIWCGHVGELLQSRLCSGTLRAGLHRQIQRQNLGLAHTQSSALGWQKDLCSPFSEEAAGCPGDSLGSSTIHPMTAFRCPRTGLLLLPPSAPQQYPGLDCLCRASLHQQIQKWMSLKPSVPVGLCGALDLGLDACSGFIAIVLSCSFVLYTALLLQCSIVYGVDIYTILYYTTLYFNAKHQLISPLSPCCALIKHLDVFRYF